MTRFVVFVAVAAVAVAAFAIGAAFFGLPIRGLSDDDEAPIIVKNGSMDIEAGSRWAWKQENDQNGVPESYVYDPDHLHFDVFNGGFWVKVSGSAIVCSDTSFPLHAQTVVVTFEPAFTVTFQRLRRGWTFWTLRNVVPAADLTLVGGSQLLRHGKPNEGYIKRVDVGTANCTFADATALKQIMICATKKRCE